MYTKICKVCFKSFEAKRVTRMYCSGACNKAAERSRNPEKNRENCKNYYHKHKETLLESRKVTPKVFTLICECCEKTFEHSRWTKKYCSDKCKRKHKYQRNKETIRLKNKEYRNNNPDKCKKMRQDYFEKNRERLNSLTNTKNKNRRQTDFCYKLRCNMRTRVGRALRSQTAYKQSNLNEYLGCTIEEYKEYLESKFLPGMSWDNWSIDGWHIDHITPLASFDLTKKEEQLKAFHFSNTQPLWAEDNLKKGSIVL